MAQRRLRAMHLPLEPSRLHRGFTLITMGASEVQVVRVRHLQMVMVLVVVLQLMLMLPKQLLSPSKAEEAYMVEVVEEGKVEGVGRVGKVVIIKISQKIIRRIVSIHIIGSITFINPILVVLGNFNMVFIGMVG